jgi:hypothetical protein
MDAGDPSPLNETRPPTDNELAELPALGVSIPFASPKLLWKTKQTYREKDAVDRIFPRKLLEDRGEWPVE